MGLLDDAIREHLELKRRRGAAPSEIARLENEALGPVRREPFDAANQRAATQADVDDGSLVGEHPSELTEAEYDEEYYEEEEEYYEEPEPDDLGEALEGSEPPSPRASTTERPPAELDRPPAEPPTEHEAQRGLRRWRRSRRGSGPPEEARPDQAEPPSHPPRENEAVGYGVDDALADRGPQRKQGPGADHPSTEEDADVLEETPEFLQDAPEHDKLWFEQRPPRDFDFDD